MAKEVYFMCALTSLLCAGLLWRSYFKRPTQLLFWCGWCFAMLAANNFFLVLDLVIYPNVNFQFWRQITTFIGICGMIYGIIFTLT